MTARYVAQEIWDATIDQLADDHKALKQTSLTCRSWHPRSRKHLFHKILVEEDPARRRYEKLVKASAKLAEISAREDSKSLSPLLPAVHYAHTLRIVFPLWQKFDDEQNGPLRPLHPEDLLSLLRPLLNLHELNIGEVGTVPSTFIETYEFAWNPSYGCVLKNLRELNISIPNFVSVAALRSIFTAFPSLNVLYIQLAESDPRIPATLLRQGRMENVTQVSPIEEFRMRLTPGDTWTAIARVLLKSPSAFRLRVLGLDIPNAQMGRNSPISDLCRAYSASLETLKIDVANIISENLNLYGSMIPDPTPVHGEYVLHVT